MKRILLSVITIMAVAGITTGATRAVFSASDEIEDNFITNGTLTLVAHNFSGNKPIGTTAVNLVPGQWTPEGRAELYNTGSVSARLYMSVTDLTGDACDKTNLKVYTGYAGGDEHARVVYNSSLQWLNTHRVELTGSVPFTTLQPNWTQVIWQQAQLASSADDTYQGKDCHWTEVFTAESVTP